MVAPKETKEENTAGQRGRASIVDHNLDVLIAFLSAVSDMMDASEHPEEVTDAARYALDRVFGRQGDEAGNPSNDEDAHD